MLKLHISFCWTREYNARKEDCRFHSNCTQRGSLHGHYGQTEWLQRHITHSAYIWHDDKKKNINLNILVAVVLACFRCHSSLGRWPRTPEKSMEPRTPSLWKSLSLLEEIAPCCRRASLHWWPDHPCGCLMLLILSVSPVSRAILCLLCASSYVQNPQVLKEP